MGFIWFMFKGAVYTLVLFFTGAVGIGSGDNRIILMWLLACGLFYGMLWTQSYLQYGNWCSFRKLYKFIKELV